MGGSSSQGTGGHHLQGTCRQAIVEADFMAVVAAVKIRQPAKQPVFGVLAAKFSKENGVQQKIREYLTHQEQDNAEAMQATADEYYSRMRASDYGREVVSEVQSLIELVKKTSGVPALPRPTSEFTATRLDFAAQAVFQVPVPERGEASTDGETIETMRSSPTLGGYRLSWLESLYRGRGEGNEEGVGPFITPLLDLRTSDLLTWVAFKQQEFWWVYDNFARQGLAMSVNLFPSDFLVAGITDILVELHHRDAAAFRLVHVELLEHEDANLPEIIKAILHVHRLTGLVLARDDVGPETFADPAKRKRLIQLCKSLEGCLTVLKLDSSLVCGAMNVPLVPRCFDRAKVSFDTEVSSKRRYREAWAAGMSDDKRKFPFPLKLINSDHFTQSSVVRTCATKLEAIEHAADVVQGFVEVSQALRFEMDIVAEVSMYANDFQRQLEHPIFGPFVKALLLYARHGKLFIQGSMGGGRALSDAAVPHLVTDPLQDTSGEMKALLEERQNSSYGGADESYHISEDFTVYGQQFAEAMNRMRLIGDSLIEGNSQSRLLRMLGLGGMKSS